MKYLSIFFLFLFGVVSYSQDLDSILDRETISQERTVSATFKGTRIINAHSIETRDKGSFDFLISHRFGRINTGFYELFGLDNSNIRFGFEYALLDGITVGWGRSSFEKTFDIFAKYSVLKQKTGKKAIPFSLTLFTSATNKTLKDYAPENKPRFSNRLTYTSQLLVARKLNSNVSLQLSPTYIHFNTVNIAADAHDIFALGIGGRIKVNQRVSINGEYYYNFNPFTSLDSKNVLALGVDIETGGHVFQILLGNSLSMIEKGFIAETTGDFLKGDIHFGFNISRTF